MHATDHPAGRHRSDDVRIVSWGPGEFSAHSDDAMQIYAQAMNYSAQTGVQRAITARRHSSNTGFACRVAQDVNGELLGFGYGYTTVTGQWWHDLVRRAVTEANRDWLVNAFELSEMHVLPAAQGIGTGRRILEALAADIPHQAMLLSTPDGDTRAFRLYRRLGFQDLARNYLFPGDSRPFAVLGARLPLRAGAAPTDPAQP
jgi:ribosomal protein S18 acetylase RimI-like enzyme